MTDSTALRSAFGRTALSLALLAASGCASVPAGTASTATIASAPTEVVALRLITLPPGWTAESVRSAETANAAPGFATYAAPPYLPGTHVARARTGSGTLTLRFSVPSEANPRGMGGWVAPFDQGLLDVAPRDAQVLLQLPHEPTSFSLVCLPTGTQADIGIVGPQPALPPSSGIAIQINLQSVVPETAWGLPVPIEGTAVPVSPPCEE
jgi:hypothetical protein